MNGHLVILTLTSIANFILGLVVWLRNPHRLINQYFGIFAVTVAAWTLSNGLVSAYAASSWGIIWARMAFASASVMALSFFLFVNEFPSRKPDPSRKLGLVFAGTGLSAFLLSFTTLIAQSTASVNGELHVTYGPLHPFFGAYFLCCASYSLFLLARKLHTHKGLERLQLRYVFLGVSLMALGATVTNLLIPLVFRSSQFSPYGPLFTIIMIGLTAHAIIRYRLMNIRFAISRSITYLVAVAIASSVFVFLLLLASKLFATQQREVPLSIELAVVLSVALLFQPLKRIIQTRLDRYVFREPYDYQRTIREISRTIGGILDLRSLLEYTCEAMSRTVQPDLVAVYIKDITAPLYRRFAIRRGMELGDTHERETVHDSSPLVALLSKEKRHVLSDELERLHSNPRLREALEDLRRLGAEFSLPILEARQLAGFFLVGPKLSGDPYFAEDIDLLTTLVSQAAIAIKNAQLYRQVVVANEYIENILATMESGVIAIASDGSVTLFNSAAERMTRLDAKHIKGVLVQNLPASLAGSLEATLADGQSRSHLETTIQDDMGHLTPVICSTSALKDGGGATLGAMAVFNDVTRLKELEGEKRHAERFASIGALASGIAHEIKNPLVAIKTFAELLPERFREEDFRGEFSRVVIREIERIDNLVARLRGLAAPVQPFTLVDLRGPIDETLTLLRGHVTRSRIKVKRVYERQLPLVAGDQVQLKQLFLNLFLNSVEAMDRGGELFIRLSCRKALGSQTVLTEITDSGTGIPEALLDKIFDPFVTTKARGSGLGLSVSRGIAEAHRATIRAQNNLNGRGTTIVIEFPVAEEIPAAIKT